MTGIPGLRSTARHSVSPSGAGTRATLTLRTTGVFAWLGRRWLEPLSRRYVAMEAAGLKRECEMSSGPSG